MQERHSSDPCPPSQQQGICIVLQGTRVTSGFRSDVDCICALLGYCLVGSGNSLPTFRDNLSVPSSRFKKSKKTSKWGR